MVASWGRDSGDNCHRDQIVESQAGCRLTGGQLGGQPVSVPPIMTWDEVSPLGSNGGHVSRSKKFPLSIYIFGFHFMCIILLVSFLNLILTTWMN